MLPTPDMCVCDRELPMPAMGRWSAVPECCLHWACLCMADRVAHTCYREVECCLPRTCLCMGRWSAAYLGHVCVYVCDRELSMPAMRKWSAAYPGCVCVCVCVCVTELSMPAMGRWSAAYIGPVCV